MKFDSVSGGEPDRSHGGAGQAARPLRVTPEDHGPGFAYGYVLGAAIAKGRIVSIDASAAERAPGVVGVVTHLNAGKPGVGKFYVQKMLAAPEVEHHHQPIAVVVAETFAQARAASASIRVVYKRATGRFDLAAQQATAPVPADKDVAGPNVKEVGDFAAGFAAAPVRIDETYTTPDQVHCMMEPHATIARWDGDRVTCWTSIQQMNWGLRDLSAVVDVPKENIRLISPYIGGGFGGKGAVQAGLAMAPIAARVVKRPVKVALQRPLMFNATIHRPATIQRLRLGAERDGRLVAIGHESWSGNLEGGRVEPTILSTRTLYAGANRLTAMRLATLDLMEGNAMRAPGEAPGLMALEVAMNELAEKLGMDPVRLRVVYDTQVDPEDPAKPFSTRAFVRCLHEGADRFGWSRRRPTPGQVRDGEWLIGLGVAGGIRAGKIATSSARARLDGEGVVTIEADMTDIGTGSYTVIQQTAAETMGVAVDRVVVRIGGSDPTISPVEAKGVGELGLTGVAPAIANAVYNATGVRVREYPRTLDKHLDRLPAVA